MVEDSWFLRRPSHRPGQQMVYLSLKVLIGGNPYGVEDAVLLQALVHIGGSEGGGPKLPVFGV